MANVPHLTVGRDELGGPVKVPLTTLLRHAAIVGGSGSGKSAWVLGVVLKLLTAYEDARIILIDPKGEAAAALRDDFLPALAAERPGLAPDAVVSVKPFGRYGVAMNPLAPIIGLPAEAQAQVVTLLLDAVVDGGLGARMRAILAWTVRAAMASRGSLQDALRLLADEAFRTGYAARIPDPEVRDYVLDVLPREPAASTGALRSRLEFVLMLPQVRAALCAQGSVTGAHLLESRLTLIDLSGAPLGFNALSRFMGGFLFQLLAAAVFARPTGAPAALVVVDELPELLRSGLDEDLCRLLEQARFKGVGLWAISQNVASIPSSLWRSLATNVSMRLHFRGSREDVADLGAFLPLTGTRIDAEVPDRLLSVEAERRLLLERLQRLPPRHALFVDHVSGSATFLQSLAVPFDEARVRARRADPALADAYERGRFGVPFADLHHARQRDGQNAPWAARPIVHAPSASGRRPKLVLP